jgi:hypothetical protein
MNKIRKYRLGLKKEDNNEYFRFVNNYNIIGRKLTFINEKIINLKQPKFFVFCQYFRIKAFNRYMKLLQKLIDGWSDNFNNFIQKPSITFSGDEERELGFLHYMRLLEQMDLKIIKVFDTTVANFVKVQERNNNQINFLIAIFSAFISITGLILALISLKIL